MNNLYQSNALSLYDKQWQEMHNLMCSKEFSQLTFKEAWHSAYARVMSKTVALWFWME